MPLRPEHSVEKTVHVPRERRFARIEGGSLRLLGGHAWACRLSFAAPMVVRYRYLYVEPDPWVDDLVCNVSMLLCDDGGKRAIQTDDMAGLFVHDGTNHRKGNEPTATDWNVDCTVTVAHDGKEVRLACPGHSERVVPAFDRTAGRIVIQSGGDVEIRLDELVVEAAVDPATLAPLRDE